jgi:hypothetical protein
VAKNLRIAASPFVSFPLFSSSWVKTGPLPASSPAAPTVAAPAVAIPFFKNERRFALFPNLFSNLFIAFLLFANTIQISGPLPIAPGTQEYSEYGD